MSSENNNILKRKNVELEPSADDQLNKRVALDSEQLELQEKHQEESYTAPVIGNNDNAEEDELESKESTQQPDEDAGKEEIPLANQEALQNIEQTLNSLSEISAGLKSFDDNKETVVEPSVETNASKPVSNHREKESDPTYVLFRMYCPVKEASCIVGKKGEKINHIREKANVRINVSENLKNVPERIVLVRGPSENVARAFGLITRTILEEPEDEPASILSKQYTLKLLVPHPMVGYIIGKQGSKFREIEENSAAKLKAAEQPLPYSTDRILSINGVGDAIHIAIYYISQVMIEHKDCLKKNKVVFYNPANYNQANLNNSMMNMTMMPNNSNMMVMGGTNPLTMQNIKDNNSVNPYNQSKQQPYNFQMMFQPSIHPQQHYGTPSSPAAPMNIPPQTPYTDEHGNTMIGEVLTNPPVQVGPNADKFNEDVYVANANIGSVIGKGGNNIKHIREHSGCSYVKIEPDRNQSILLGNGKGLTNIRKLTLTGSLSAIQTAIYLINQRIGADKERNSQF